MTVQVETVIIGGEQAGLALSYKVSERMRRLSHQRSPTEVGRQAYRMRCH
jgi:hypothetical protein